MVDQKELKLGNSLAENLVVDWGYLLVKYLVFLMVKQMVDCLGHHLVDKMVDW